MKKFYVLILGAMLGLTAHAQDEWRLDSTYVENDNGVRSQKNVFEYDSNKQLAVEYETDYDEGKVYKYVYSYDDNGRVNLMRIIVDDSVIQEIEVTEYDAANGLPKVYIIKTSDNSGQGLSLYGKYEMTYYEDRTEQALYQWTGLSYELYYTTIFYYDNFGLLTYELVKLFYEGETYDYSVTAYEYDDYGNKTKEEYQDLIGNEMTTIYENTYDENGNLKKIRETSEGVPASNEFYFWSKFSSAAINGLKANTAITDWFDLNGRHLNGKPTKKGLFILNGQKIMIK